MPSSKRSAEEIVIDDNEPVTKRLRSGRAVGSPEPSIAESADHSADRTIQDNTRPTKSIVTPVVEYGLDWRQRGSMFVLDSITTHSGKHITGTSKIAAFDMDSTLIITKSGKRFPTGRSDWKWLFPEVPLKLRQLYEEGIKLVIFTNQNGISTGASSAASIKGKITDIINDLGLPMQAFIASADDLYRKPSTHMWRDFTQHHNEGVTVDLDQSIYVGDAAGRPARWNGKADTKKDHSAADRKFAKNVGLPFATPEPYFLGHKESHYEMDADLGNMFKAMLDKETSSKTGETVTISSDADTTTVSIAPAATVATLSEHATDTSSNDHAQKHQELVIFVGFPAAGKTTFAKKHFVANGYVHINRDTLKDAKKCLSVTEAAIARGESCVVDNTNPNRADRAKYIAFAKRKGIPVRAYQFMTTEAEAKHLNMYREKLTNGAHKHVSRIAYNVYKKNLTPPTLDEGYTVVKQVHFSPEFESEYAKKLFSEQS